MRVSGKVMNAVGEVARIVGEEIEKIAEDEPQASSENRRVYKQQMKRSKLENGNAK